MKKVNRRSFIKGGILAAFGFLISDTLWFERFVIDWNSYDLGNNKDNPLKFIQISDLHLQDLHYAHRSIGKKINSLQPDLIFMTGDVIDDKNKVRQLDQFLELIDKKIKKIAILGNWEYWGKVDLNELKETYQRHNGTLLVNECLAITLAGRRINVIGLDDYVGGNADYNKAISQMEPANTNIVLSHCPAYRDILFKINDNTPIDLVLSGHTHGGQINILGYVPFKPIGSGKYLKGWYLKDGPPMYVSKGVGTSRLPLRLGSRAEVVEFIL